MVGAYCKGYCPGNIVREILSGGIVQEPLIHLHLLGNSKWSLQLCLDSGVLALRDCGCNGEYIPIACDTDMYVVITEVYLYMHLGNPVETLIVVNNYR